MDRELTPAELRDLLPAYAVDAIDDDERRAVEEYLASDPEARDEVIEMQRTASFLAHAGGPPPTGVWERLEAAIRESSGPEGAVPPPRLVPLTQPLAPRRSDRAWRWVAVAAAIVAVAFVSLWAVDRGGSDPEVDTAALAQAAASTPGAQHAVLRDDDGNVLARAVLLSDGTGFVTSTGLPALGDDRTYQLWAVDDRGTISLGVMGSEPEVVAFHAGDETTALAITNERAGGVAQSAEVPTAVGELAA
jgi:anti-sigma-K factor RskA